MLAWVLAWLSERDAGAACFVFSQTLSSPYVIMDVRACLCVCMCVCGARGCDWQVALCWHQDPARRPSMAALVEHMHVLLSDHLLTHPASKTVTSTRKMIATAPWRLPVEVCSG